jgi:penicillin-binding protein 2
MMVSQGGTGSGTSGPAIRKIWETLYGVRGDRVVDAKAALPGGSPPAGLPVFAKDGEILPPAVRDQGAARNEKPARTRRNGRRAQR